MDTSRSQSRLPVADLASFPTRSQEKKLSVAEDPYQIFKLKFKASCLSYTRMKKNNESKNINIFKIFYLKKKSDRPLFFYFFKLMT